MEFNSKINLLTNLKLFYITIPCDVLNETREDTDKSAINQRYIITINKSIQWRAGSVALSNNDAYITISKKRMKELDVHLNDTVDVHLEKDRSEFGMEVPAEFTEVLEQDLEAKHRFYLLPKGLQRAIIYIVSQLKSSDKRIEKSLFLLENLKCSPIEKTTMRHILGKE